MFGGTTFPNFRQLDQMDCGPMCLRIITKYYGKDLNLEYLKWVSGMDKDGSSLAGLSQALDQLGMDAIGIRCNLPELVHEIPLPVRAHWENNHFLVVYKATKKNIYVSDPAIGLVRYGHSEFTEKWGDKKKGDGILLLVEPKLNFYKEGNDETFGSEPGPGFLYRYLLPYKAYLGHLFLGLLLASTIQLLLPFLTQSLVDHGIDFGNLGFIHLVVLAQFFLFITRLISEIIRDWLLLHMSVQINIAMISDFLDKLLLLPMTYFESRSTGDFIQRINDHHRIDELLGGNSLSIAFDLFSILAFAIVLGYFHTVILLIFLIGTFCFLGWTLLFLKRKAVLDHKLFNLNRNEQSLLIQLLSAIREIRLNGSERRRKLEWKEVQGRLYRLRTSLLQLDQFQLKGGSLINESTNIFIIFWSAKAVITGEITLGAMLAIQFIIGSLSGPIANTVDFIAVLQKASLSFKRLSEIHSHPQEPDRPNSALDITMGDIHIHNLQFGFGANTAHKILDNISVTIPKGKTTAIVGHSGSGKSTLLKLLLKLYEPNRGHIKIGDEDLLDLDSKKWRETCGSVLQDSILFHDTLERNITESASDRPLDRKRLAKAISLANLRPVVDLLPRGLDTRIGENGMLSGGEKQRVLLARAIYKDPDYLFLDEASSALDAENERIISENLMGYGPNKTIVLVAHRLSTIRKADQIMVMGKGRILEIGDHQELLDLKGSYHKLIMDQL